MSCKQPIGLQSLALYTVHWTVAEYERCSFSRWLGPKSAILSSTRHFIHFSPPHWMLRCMRREINIYQYMLLQLQMMHFWNLNLGSSPPVVSENSCSCVKDWAELLVRFWETFWLSPGWFIINEIWPLAARQNYHLTLSLCNNGPKLCCCASQHRHHHHH